MWDLGLPRKRASVHQDSHDADDDRSAAEPVAEQRRHARYPERLSVDVHLHVVPGATVQDSYELGGRTVNIGRGGVLVRLDEELKEGLRVRVRFSRVPDGVRLWPLVTSGTVVRLEPADIPAITDETYLREFVAIQFSEPLEELDLRGAEE